MSDLQKSLFGRALTEVGQELKHKFAHGEHELAAALFNGHGFVMYPKNQAAEQNQSQEKMQEQPERGNGRSM
jgi:hypothetical protein